MYQYYCFHRDEFLSHFVIFLRIDISLLCFQLAFRSSTVTAKTITPIAPIRLAVRNGARGANFQSSPPIAAAGGIVKLRIR